MFSWCHWWIFTKLKRVKDSSEAYIRVCQEWTSVSGRSIMWCDGPSPNILRLGGSAICRLEHFCCTKPFLFWNISMKCETSSKWRCRLAQTILHSWSSGRLLVIGRMLQELIVIFFQVARNKKKPICDSPTEVPRCFSQSTSPSPWPAPLLSYHAAHTQSVPFSFADSAGHFYNPFFCFYIDSFLFMKSNAKDFVARITLIMM